jgi:hypothetical protein
MAINREQWLTRLAKEMERVLFKPNKDLIITENYIKKGKLLPDYRVSVGFGRNNKHIGEAHSPTRSGDQTAEIFISPENEDQMKVAGILAHELVHVAVGNKHGHNSKFKALATKIGLTGKMTATSEGPEFIEKIERVLKKMPAYPHAALAVGQKVKEAPTWAKAVCPDSGFNVRISAKQLRDFGPPLSPVTRQSMKII